MQYIQNESEMQPKPEEGVPESKEKLPDTKVGAGRHCIFFCCNFSS